MTKHPVIYPILVILGLMGTLFAIGDKVIYKATFVEFKEYMIYRMDSMDKKLDIILEEKPQK
jgi:hypothetical protein